jgi:hypothetical protein
MGVPMVPAQGTPTVQYFTLYQLKLLGVPAGQASCCRRWCYKKGLRAGPFAVPGVVASIKMSTIQNMETIVHLHWLRQQYPDATLGYLIVHTASVDYAETTAVQCGYTCVGTEYVAGREWEDEIGNLMDDFEDGNAAWKAAHDNLLARFSFSRRTVMKQNFDIEISVEPLLVD